MLILLALLQSPEEEALKRLTAELPAHVKAADADGNGALAPAEFRAFAEALEKAGKAILNELDPSKAKKKADKDLEKYDLNKDATLDEAEKKALAEAKRLKDIKDFDWDEDGKLGEKEAQAMAWAAEGKSLALFRKVDANADGALGQEELAKAVALAAGIKVKKAKAQ
jgi:hypothetical protein